MDHLKRNIIKYLDIDYIWRLKIEIHEPFFIHTIITKEYFFNSKEKALNFIVNYIRHTTTYHDSFQPVLGKKRELSEHEKNDLIRTTVEEIRENGKASFDGSMTWMTSNNQYIYWDLSLSTVELNPDVPKSFD